MDEKIVCPRSSNTSLRQNTISTSEVRKLCKPCRSLHHETISNRSTSQLSRPSPLSQHVSLDDKYAFSARPEHVSIPRERYNVWSPPQDSERRTKWILGIKRRHFWVLVIIVVVLLIGGAIGGVVAKFGHAKNIPGAIFDETVEDSGGTTGTERLSSTTSPSNGIYTSTFITRITATKHMTSVISTTEILTAIQTPRKPQQDSSSTMDSLSTPATGAVLVTTVRAQTITDFKPTSISDIDSEFFSTTQPIYPDTATTNPTPLPSIIYIEDPYPSSHTYPTDIYYDYTSPSDPLPDLPSELSPKPK